MIDVGRGGNAGEGELNAHSDSPKLTDIVGAVSESGEGLRRPIRAVFGKEMCPSAAWAGVGVSGAVGEADDGGRRGLGHLASRIGKGAASLSWGALSSTAKGRSAFGDIVIGDHGVRVGGGGFGAFSLRCVIMPEHKGEAGNAFGAFFGGGGWGAR